MKRERKMIKRGFITFLAVILLLGTVLTFNTTNVKAAIALPTASVAQGGGAASEFTSNKGDYSTWTTKSDGFTVDAKYGFYPIKTDQTTITPFGKQSDKAFTDMINIYGDSKPLELSKNCVFGFDARTATKGEVGWKGTNFKVYNTETGKYDYIDIKTTITDWDAIDSMAYMFLAYSEGARPSFNMYGILEAKMNMSYFKAGTNEPYVLNSHFTVDDIDADQYFGFSAAPTVKQYVSSTSKLNYMKTEGMNLFHYPDSTNQDNGDPDYAVGAIYSTDSMSFVYGNTHLLDENRKNTWSHFGFYSSAMAPIEPPTPIKSVSDSDENGVTDNVLESSKEEFVYEVSQNVPDGYTEGSYFKNFTISDQLEPVLDINEVSVVDEEGEDVSQLFDITNEDNLVKASATNLTNKSFYNHMYTLKISCTIKEDADLSKYTDVDVVTIPNKGTVTINDEPSTTNEVTTKYNVPKIAIEKDVDHYEWNVGEMVAYKVKVNQIVENARATDVVIKDISLPAHLAYDENTITVEGIEEDQYEIYKEDNGWVLKTPKLDYNKEVLITFEAEALEESAGIETVNTATADCRETDEISDDAVVKVPSKDPQSPGEDDPKINSPGNDSGKISAHATKTGDPSDYLFWIAGLLIAGLVTVMTLVKARK